MKGMAEHSPFIAHALNPTGSYGSHLRILQNGNQIYFKTNGTIGPQHLTFVSKSLLYFKCFNNVTVIRWMKNTNELNGIHEINKVILITRSL